MSSASFPFEPCHFEPGQLRSLRIKGNQGEKSAQLETPCNFEMKQNRRLCSPDSNRDLALVASLIGFIHCTGLEMTRFKGEGRRGHGEDAEGT